MKPRIAVMIPDSIPNNLGRRIIASQDIERLKGFAEVVNGPMPDGDPARVKEVIAGADGCITSWDIPLLTADLLDRAPSLKMIAHAAGSVKSIVTEAVWDRGISVSSAASAIAVGVAEHALGLMLSSMKRCYQLNDHIHNGGWRDPVEMERIKETYRINVGVVGAGHAGRHFIRLLKCFDLETLLYDPFVSRHRAEEMGVVSCDSLDDMVRQSDVISLHAPSLPETHHMINAQNLKMMKDGAIIINTARGSLIDEAALYEELKTGRITACLDVTDPEPPAEDHPLRTLPNVIFTPHISGVSSNNIARVGNLAVMELERFFSGKPLEHQVTKEQLQQIA